MKSLKLGETFNGSGTISPNKVSRCINVSMHIFGAFSHTVCIFLQRNLRKSRRISISFMFLERFLTVSNGLINQILQTSDHSIKNVIINEQWCERFFSPAWIFCVVSVLSIFVKIMSCRRKLVSTACYITIHSFYLFTHHISTSPISPSDS